ncbi:hypothetical protein FNV43_RR09818 [Rhamnella rubrinervis]|uniref:Uncharacterized protein n=1 Tax=Rhamnella rubrinervis TaxID=2594499 RepID=A0A8K0HBF8_9ROSA|nr:hypothetical protein FNV43_RR09818 [Rhamnella rubrinervis]
MSASEGIHISSTPSASASVLDSLTSDSSTLSPSSIPPASQNIGDDSISVFEYLNAIMGRAYRENHYDHAKYFRSFNDPEEAQRHPYKDVEPEDWDWLCTHFAGEHYQPPTQLKITQQVLGTKPGYYHGLGYGPKPPPSSRTSRRVNQEVLEEVTQLREEVQELRSRNGEIKEVTQLREEVQELRSKNGEIKEVTQLREEVQELRGIRDEMHQYRQMMEKMQQFITVNMGSCSTGLQTFQRQFPPPPPPSTAI